MNKPDDGRPKYLVINADEGKFYMKMDTFENFMYIFYVYILCIYYISLF